MLGIYLQINLKKIVYQALFASLKKEEVLKYLVFEDNTGDFAKWHQYEGVSALFCLGNKIQKVVSF